MKERMVPQNIEAEKSVLGSILIDPSTYDLVSDILKPDDFYRSSHRTIYQAILSIVVQGMQPDSITLCDELERIGKLEEIDGAGYIMGLASFPETSGNAEQYAKIVSRAAVNRRLAHAAGMIAQLAYDQDPQSVEKAEQLIYSIQSTSRVQAWTGMSELMAEHMTDLDFVHEHRGNCLGVPTGYTDIDNALGRLQKTDLILLGGRPGSGKSSLGLCIGYNAALAGCRVAIFSLEMGKRQLAWRLESMVSKVDLQRLRSGWIRDEEWDMIIQKAGQLSQLPIHINDTAGNSIASMRSQLRRLIQEHGGVDLVIVDYLGLIAPDEASENRVQEVSKITWGLKKIAKEFELPVLTLAQLSRQVEQRQNKRPILSDLRESGSCEQDADVVLFLYREDYYAELEKREDYTPTHEAEVSIAKHRNGPTGGVTLFFKEDQTMFYNLEHKLKNQQ